MKKNIEKLSIEVSGEALEEVANFIFARASENIVSMEPETMRRLANVSATKRTKYAEGPPTDTGMLMKSGRIEKKKDSIMIGWDVPYASIVEYGRGPGGVSYFAILEWVNRKLKVKDAEHVAAAISASIAAKGTNPKPFLRAAINAAISRYGKAL